MTDWVSPDLRHLVRKRADERCEYCLFPQAAAWLSFEVEHIIARKHRGQSVAGNTALACPDCNRFKGTDLGSIDPETGKLTPFYNPRTQVWTDHFRLDSGRIVSLTAEARVTEIILQLNLPERIAERERLIIVGRYPSKQLGEIALSQIKSK